MRKKKLVRICAKCGKRVEELHEGLCEECFSIMKGLRRSQKQEMVEVNWCRCGLVSACKKELGFASTFGELLELVLSHSLDKEARDAELTFEVEEVQNMGRDVYRVVGVLDGKDRTVVEIKLTRKLCESCRYRSGGYYEATLQLRGDEDFLANMLELVEDIANKWREFDKKSFITSMEGVRGGIDVKLGSKRLAKKIVSQAKKYKKDIIIKCSKKLKTVKDGKKIYRYTFAVKVDNYGKKRTRKGR